MVWSAWRCGRCANGMYMLSLFREGVASCYPRGAADGTAAREERCGCWEWGLPTYLTCCPGVMPPFICAEWQACWEPYAVSAAGCSTVHGSCWHGLVRMTAQLLQLHEFALASGGIQGLPAKTGGQPIYSTSERRAAQGLATAAPARQHKQNRGARPRHKQQGGDEKEVLQNDMRGRTV